MMRRVAFLLAGVFLFLAADEARSLADTTPPEEDQPEVSTIENAEDKEEDSTPMLGEVVVRERKAEEGLSVEEIPQARLEEKSGRAVTEVLRDVPSVYLRQNVRGEWVFTVRGFDQRQMLILVDGVPFLSPYDGRVDLGKFPAGLLQKIELIKGAKALAAGANGLGGAVNLITKKPGTGKAVELRQSLAYPWAFSLDATAQDTLGPLAVLVTGGLRKDYGWNVSGEYPSQRNEGGLRRENSQSENAHAALKLSLELDDNEVDAQTWFLHGEAGVPPHDRELSVRYWQWKPWWVSQSVLRHRVKLTQGIHLEERLFGSWYENTLYSYDDARMATQDTAKGFISTYREAQLGAIVLADAVWKPGFVKRIDLRPWLSLRYNRHEGEEDGQREASLSAMTLSTVLHHRWKVTDAFGFTLGGQLDAEFPGEFPQGSDDQSLLSYGPLLALWGKPHPSLKLEANVMRRGRFPTLRERFSGAFGTRIPNPDLHAESAWHIGLDLSWKPIPQFTVQLSGYDAEVSDLIEQIALNGNRTKMVNVAQARLAGAEAKLMGDPFSFLHLEGGYAFLHAEKLSTSEFGESELLYRPSHKGFIGLRATPYRFWTLSTDVQVIGPQRYQNDLTGALGTLGAYPLWNGRMDFLLLDTPRERLSIYANGENLSDTHYQTAFGYPGMGRRFYFGFVFGYDPAASPPDLDSSLHPEQN